MSAVPSHVSTCSSYVRAMLGGKNQRLARRAACLEGSGVSFYSVQCGELLQFMESLFTDQIEAIHWFELCLRILDQYSVYKRACYMYSCLNY